ncbi:MAG: hypothetical protein U9R72_01160 [Chloroflexota bacterium]|nr:hypothetical protein [Chloroflexota bacterium]
MDGAWAVGGGVRDIQLSVLPDRRARLRRVSFVRGGGCMGGASGWDVPAGRR